jgi:hypothetical protein
MEIINKSKMKKESLENVLEEMKKTIEDFKQKKSTQQTIDKLARLKGKENQSNKKEIVKEELQKPLRDLLMSMKLEIDWSIEYKMPEVNRDSTDIFGELKKEDNSIIVIEIDAHRADQVAKKFLSRNAIFLDKNLIYVSLCYFGTWKMSLNECNKYHEYCHRITKNLFNDGSVIKMFHHDYLFDEIQSGWN